MELEDEDDLFKTPISPFCDEIFYCYYGDEDAGPRMILKSGRFWIDLEENVQSGKFRIPDFIKLYLNGNRKTWKELLRSRLSGFLPSGIEEEPFIMITSIKDRFGFYSCIDCSAFDFVHAINAGNRSGITACQSVSSKG